MEASKTAKSSKVKKQIKKTEPNIYSTPIVLNKPTLKKKKTSNTYSTAYSGRCQSYTKKGSQCKRTASRGSSYCWQHG